MDKKEVISIVTPTYNEKDNIEFFVEKVSSYLSKKNLPFEIIVVDDNSPDGTAQIVHSLSKKYPYVRLISRQDKRGIGSAYFDGFSKATGDILVGIDADLSQSLETLDHFLKEFNQKKDMIVASRYMSASRTYGIPKIKQFGGRCFNFCVGFLLGLPIRDISHSYRAFTRDLFKDISGNLIENGHPSFFIEFSFWAQKKGYSLSEVPTLFKERAHGQSKLNLYQGLLKGLRTVFRLYRIK